MVVNDFEKTVDFYQDILTIRNYSVAAISEDFIQKDSSVCDDKTKYSARGDLLPTTADLFKQEKIVVSEDWGESVSETNQLILFSIVSSRTIRTSILRMNLTLRTSLRISISC